MSDDNWVAAFNDLRAQVAKNFGDLAEQITLNTAAVKAVRATSPEAVGRVILQAHTEARGLLENAFAPVALGANTLATTSASLGQTAATLAGAINDSKKAARSLNIRAVLVLVLAVALVFAGSAASLWWQQQQVASLKPQLAALTAEIIQERANVAALDAKGGRIQFTQCGGRLCFQEAQDQGPGWGSAGAQFIIPDGY